MFGKIIANKGSKSVNSSEKLINKNAKNKFLPSLQIKFLSSVTSIEEGTFY